MNPMRNPWVVGALAVVAVALLGRNAVFPILKRSLPQRQAQSALRATPAPQAPATPAVTGVPGRSQPVALETPATNTVRRPSLDEHAILTRLKQWFDKPRRDPFHNVLERKNRAMEMLTLQAVWRQTGSTLAVINNTVVREGDTLLEYTIERIEMDGVWVLGANGREGVRFKSGLAPRSPEGASKSEKADSLQAGR